jgi:hypothetical protein
LYLKFYFATYVTVKSIKHLISLASMDFALCYMVLDVLMRADRAAGAAGWSGRVGGQKFDPQSFVATLGLQAPA